MSGAHAPADPFVEARLQAALDAADRIDAGDVVHLDPNARGVFVKPLGDYLTEPTDWLWKDRIPAGELTVIAGDGGLGKSTFTAWLAGQVTSGQARGLTGTRKVAVALAEDHPARTLRPRFEAAGADMDRVAVITGGTQRFEEPLQLPDDLDLLAATIEREAPDLLIVDPLTALLNGAVDAHRDGGRGGMRAVLNPLSRIAQDYGTTVVAVFHLNKGAGPAAQRIGGSTAIRNAARNVLLFAQHPDSREAGDDDGRRIVGHDKCNYGPTQVSLDATIAAAPVRDAAGLAILNRDGEAVTTSLLTMGGPSDVDYTDAIRAASAEPREHLRSDDAVGDATAFLRVELAAGPVAVSDLKAAAKDAGHSWRTIERAFSDLGVKSAKQGPRWVRFLPSADDGGLGGHDQSPVVEPDSLNLLAASPPTPPDGPTCGGLGGDGLSERPAA